jgi:hypothetical protein
MAANTSPAVDGAGQPLSVLKRPDPDQLICGGILTIHIVTLHPYLTEIVTKELILATVTAAALAGAAPAEAGWVHVGSWDVNQGPSWNSRPLACTGQQAAALLFGGTASQYAIPTNGSNPDQIGFQAWYSILGYHGPHGGGVALAENYESLHSTQAARYY